MPPNDAKKTRSGVQLKTPKGTRDWVGSDLILRDHILYVLLMEAECQMLY
jgi:histidyl-tRNA synthetase